MVPLLSHHASGANGGGALNRSLTTHLKSADPIPPLFSKRHRPDSTISRRLKAPLSLPNSSTAAPATTNSTYVPFIDDEERSVCNSMSNSNPFGAGVAHIEGIIQFESPNSFLSILCLVAVLAAGDVAVLLTLSAIGRFIHGFSVFDVQTFFTADPFIAGWFLSAYFLGEGYGDEGRGMNGLWAAVSAATKSWSFGIPLGLMVKSVTTRHTPSMNFIFVTMGSTAIMLVGWRALLFSILATNQRKKNDLYKRGSTCDLFELLTSLVRRW